MEPITTNTYQTQVDERFEVAAKELEYFTLVDKACKHKLQMPMLNMALSEIKDLTEETEFKADTYTGTLVKYFAIKRYQVQLDGEIDTIDVAGKSAYFQKAFSEVEHGNSKVKIHHYFINIPLDEEFMLEVSADFEDSVYKEYEPILWDAFNHIEFLGNYRTHIDEQNRKVEERMAETEARLAEFEQQHQDLLSGELSDESDDEDLSQNWDFQPTEDELINIGSFKFQFVEQDCLCKISDFSKKLYLQIQAKTNPKTKNFRKAIKKGLLEDAYDLDKGEIKFSFGFPNIYQNGTPTGDFLFEESKTGAPHFIDVRIHGSDLDFYGKIVLKEGWIGIKGVLKKSYDHNPPVSIEIHKKLDTSNLDWSHYRFNQTELAQFPEPLLIRHISITDNELNAFPAKILDCANLQTLFLSGNAHNCYPPVKASLHTIPQEIGNLTKLEELSIVNTQFSTLPNSIKNLSKLHRLNLSNNQLSTLPDGAFQLPELKSLWASDNCIENIPDVINLPSLKNIDLSENQLSTLPESLAKLTQIDEINIEENPLENLPDAFNSVNVELNINEKRRLLDYSYQGADGKGTIDWDDAIFFAQYDDELKQRLLDSTEEGILSKYRKAFLKIGFKSVGMNITNADDYASIGNTRFGGLPDLPEGMEYPGWDYDYDDEQGHYHYQFIAQLNCEELASFQSYLPRTGILYFFINDQEDFKPKVIFVPQTTKLVSAKSINENDLNVYDDHGVFEPYRVEASKFVGIPHFYQDELWTQVYDLPELEQIEDWDGADKEAYDKVSERFKEQLGKKGKKIWNGYHLDWQHSINDYVFTQNEQPQEQAALKLKGNPEDYMVLLKVNSDNDHECGFCFWDAGDLFFVIHKSDLAKHDFSNIYCSIETS